MNRLILDPLHPGQPSPAICTALGSGGSFPPPTGFLHLWRGLRVSPIEFTPGEHGRNYQRSPSCPKPRWPCPGGPLWVALPQV